MRYRKRPVEITATRARQRQVIHTLEGDMVAEPGDWIVTGIQGEIYPVKDDIFRQTYEPVGISWVKHDCLYYGIQDCHVCDDCDCGDNLDPACDGRT